MSAEPGRPPLWSLTQRLALTVVSAFIVVFVMLFGVLWQQTLALDTGELDRISFHTARNLVAALDEFDSDDAARTALRVFDVLQTVSEPYGMPPVYAKVGRRDGSFSHDGHPTLATLDLAVLPDGRSIQPLGNAEWQVYTVSGQRWKVALADDLPARSREFSRQLVIDLGTYLGLALPIVLLPVWWLARATLKPLQRLSDAVAARAPLDTTPLPRQTQWRELAPLEQALNRLFERTAAGVEREKAFVHDAAHELRTPLAVINAQAHVLAGSEGPARETALRHLQDAVARASHLTQQLLQLAQADAAARRVHEAVDLMNLARDAMSLLAERAASQGTELDLQGPDHAPLVSDPRALRSIVDNLLDNALRYGGPGGAVQVRVESAGAGGTLRLIVSDSGPGIAAADHEHVFERFWRGGSAVAGHHSGTGLGLAIVREAARALGGEARVQASSAGTTLVVELPVR